MRRFLIGLAVVAMATTMLAIPAAVAADTTVTPAGDTVAVFDVNTGQWAFRDRSGNVTTAFYGNPGDMPLAGDWNGDGTDTPGLHRASDGYVYLRNSNSQGVADIRFFAGNPGDVAIAGDFNNDGKDTVSLYRPTTGQFFIFNSLGANNGGIGAADSTIVFGNPGDKPFAGDFNGNGTDTFGLHRESTGQVFLRNSNTTGIADVTFVFGDPGDRIFAADYNRDGKDTVGVFRPSDGKVYLRYSNTSGAANLSFFFGSANSMPVAGDFNLKTSLDIVDTAVADGRFTTLAAALGAASLVDTLKGEGPFTVFAPTDAAFAKLPAGTVESLLANIPALTDILTYHVVAGEVPASQVVTLSSAKTLEGQNVWIKVENGKVFLNNAEVIITDVYASNGVIHVIDTVLQPLDIVDTAVYAGFDTLAAALTATEGTTKLATALKGTGPFTVFAPTDDAFAKLPAGTLTTLLADPGGALSDILKYHVVTAEVKADKVVTLPSASTLLGQNVWIKVENGKVFLNNAQVVMTDIQTTNGVIHVIDTVLQPLDIVDTAVYAGFDTLAAALTATEGTTKLATALKGTGPFTVFAPTDDAFAKLPAGTLTTLLADPGGALSDILKYHVVTAEVKAATVVTLDKATTLLGKDAYVRVDGSMVMLNDANVTATDIMTTNGVIHVLDSVLLPPAVYTASVSGSNEVPPVATSATGTAKLAVINAASGLVCYDLDITGLSGTPVAAHIHDGDAGANGPVVINFDYTTNGNTGCVTASPTSVVSDITAGPTGYYFNIHTAANPGGEVRGQLPASAS